jgi:hypothetical protein
MQSKHLVMGAAVLLAHLIPFSAQAAGQLSPRLLLARKCKQAIQAVHH